MDVPHRSLRARAYRFVKRHDRLRRAARAAWRLCGRVLPYCTPHPLDLMRSMRPRRLSLIDVRTLAGRESRHAPARQPALTTVHPPATIHRPMPRPVGGRPLWLFDRHRDTPTPETFVARLEHGQVLGEGNVLTADFHLLGEVSKVAFRGSYIGGCDNPLLAKRFFPPFEHVRGSVAVLSAPAGTGYYHWLFDVLPRIHLLEAAAIDLAELDYFHVNALAAPYHRETLACLDIEPRRLLTVARQPALRADTLYVPSLPGRLGHVPEWVCRFLRDRFLPTATGGDGDPPGSLYISRRRAGHRVVSNEDAVVALLEGHGFRSVALEDLTFAEQVRTMAAAERVVAPHGAGLSNVVFCRPGTRVIELMPSSAWRWMFWTISGHAGLDYSCIYGPGGAPPADPRRQDVNAPMTVDLVALEEALCAGGRPGRPDATPALRPARGPAAAAAGRRSGHWDG